MPKDQTAPGRSAPEIVQALTYAQTAVSRQIEAFRKLPPWKDNTTELLAVLDTGRLILNVCLPLAKALGEGDGFAALYQQCQDNARPWVPKARLADFPDRKTNALILDVLYEIQRDVRALKKTSRKKAVVSLAERRVA